MPPRFSALWDHHPGLVKPCDEGLFANQCAIRMGIALEQSGVNTAGFAVRRCSKSFPALKSHAPGHILSAQELADALHLHANTWPEATRTRKLAGSMRDNWDTFEGKYGIVFIQNGWGNTDHIDVWNGHLAMMKGAGGNSAAYRAVGQRVWFWRLE